MVFLFYLMLLNIILMILNLEYYNFNTINKMKTLSIYSLEA